MFGCKWPFFGRWGGHSAVGKAVLECELGHTVGDGDALLGIAQSEIPLSAGEFAGTVTVQIAESDLKGNWDPKDADSWGCRIRFKVGGDFFVAGFTPANPTFEPAVYEPKNGTTPVTFDLGNIANTPSGAN